MSASSQHIHTQKIGAFSWINSLKCNRRSRFDMQKLPLFSTESVRLWRKPSQRFDATFTGLSLWKAPLSEHMIESWQVDCLNFLR